VLPRNFPFPSSPAPSKWRLAFVRWLARSFSIHSKDRTLLGGLALFGLITAICPSVRAFYHFEINYVDGWNVYNALKVAQHVPLYGAKYGWTTINYLALSFYVVACVSRLTHEVLDAIARNYVLTLNDSNFAIYVPAVNR
jgi:hypothetical protein